MTRSVSMSLLVARVVARMAALVALAACGGEMQRAPGPDLGARAAPRALSPRAPLPRKTLALGSHHLCFIDEGEVFCRGASEQGQLGGVEPEDGDAFIRVPGVTTAERIAAGEHGTCVLDAVGAVTCWGRVGEAGTGNAEPRRIVSAPRAIDIAVSRSRACAALDDGTVTCWNSAGHTETIPQISNATAITSGWFHTCARRADGQVSCFGGDGWGALGSDAPPEALIEVEGAADIVAFDADAMHACAARGDQSLFCWGQPRPTISGVRDAVGIGVGRSHACILHRGGLVSCVGEGTHGELGDGHQESAQVPVLVQGLSDVTELAVSGETSCARSATGWQCWGALWPFSIDIPGYRTRPSPLRLRPRTASAGPPASTPPDAIVLAGAPAAAAAHFLGTIFDVQVSVTAAPDVPLTGTLPRTSARAAFRALAELGHMTYRPRRGRPGTVHVLAGPRAAAGAASEEPPTPPLPCPVEATSEAGSARVVPCAASDTVQLVGVAGGPVARALVTAVGHGAGVVTLGTAVGASELHWGLASRSERALSTPLRVEAIGAEVVYLHRGPEGPRSTLELGAPAARALLGPPRDF